MSQEIVDAVKALGAEKGIAEDKLIGALEDALLSAYKKQPDAAKYARVEMDPDTGDYRVIELIVQSQCLCGGLGCRTPAQVQEDQEFGEAKSYGVGEALAGR